MSSVPFQVARCDAYPSCACESFEACGEQLSWLIGQAEHARDLRAILHICLHELQGVGALNNGASPATCEVIMDRIRAFIVAYDEAPMM